MPFQGNGMVAILTSNDISAEDGRKKVLLGLIYFFQTSKIVVKQS